MQLYNKNNNNLLLNLALMMQNIYNQEFNKLGYSLDKIFLN